MIANHTLRPNFMIAGAPKCGTTALYEYLSTHPQVFLTDPKEPHYFAEDLGDHRSIFTQGEYEALFARVRPHHLAIGEASAWYLHSAVALPRIQQELPDVKLIVMLRNPVEMLRSLHSDMVWICFEDEPDFQAAWHLQEQRRSGERISRLCQVPWFLQYREIGRLAKHVQRLLALFPREQVKFFLLDDLQHTPQRVYLEALQFLELPNDGRQEFPRVNAGKRNRWHWLARTQSTVVRALPRHWIEAGKRIGLGTLNRAVTRLNSKSQVKASIDLAFQRQLAAESYEDICHLEDLLQRRLDHWKKLPEHRHDDRRP